MILKLLLGKSVRIYADFLKDASAVTEEYIYSMKADTHMDLFLQAVGNVMKRDM